jgi:hypothetical protein
MLTRWLTPLAVAVLVVMLIVPAPAFAQYDYYSSGAFSFNQNNYPDLSQRKWKKPGAASTPAPTTRSSPRRAAPMPSETSSLPISPLPYTRDRAFSNDIRSEFLVDLAGRGSATDVMQMAKMMAQYDFVQVFAGMARQQGLDSGTPEGLTALFYGQAWAIANKQPLPPARQYQAIAKQLRDTNARAKVWNTLDNRGRQKLVETLAYPIIVQKANYEAYRREGRTTALEDMATRVQAGMKNFKMDMRATKLTDAGFDRLP